MRSLITSSVILVLLISGWVLFYDYTCNKLPPIVQVCERDIISAMEENRWEFAYTQCRQQQAEWKKYRKRALLILERDKIQNIDANFEKTLMYMKARDLSNSSGELLALTTSITNLYLNEKIHLFNIL